MKKPLLNISSSAKRKWGAAARSLALGSIFVLATSLAASAQWVIYEANELPLDFSPAFKTSNVAPAVTEAAPAVVATEQFITDDPSKSGNKLLNYKFEGAPHTSFMWRQDFTDAPSAATVVVRAKGIDGLNRVLEMDLDFAGFRETVFVYNNNTFTFNVVRGDLQNVALPTGFDVLAWHTYRFTKSAGTTTLYIDEDNTPIASGTSTTGGRTQNYFRLGDGQSSANYGAQLDYIAWDQSGAFSPSQKALPTGLLLSSKGENITINGLKLYPNPSSGKVLVSHPAARKGASLEVYSLSGVKVASFGVDQNSKNTTLALEGLTKGVYSLVYTDNVERFTCRLVKQ